MARACQRGRDRCSWGTTTVVTSRTRSVQAATGPEQRQRLGVVGGVPLAEAERREGPVRRPPRAHSLERVRRGSRSGSITGRVIPSRMGSTLSERLRRTDRSRYRTCLGPGPGSPGPGRGRPSLQARHAVEHPGLVGPPRLFAITLSRSRQAVAHAAGDHPASLSHSQYESYLVFGEPGPGRYDRPAPAGPGPSRDHRGRSPAGPRPHAAPRPGRAVASPATAAGAALPGTALHYAVKANPDPALLAALAGPGAASTSPARPRWSPPGRGRADRPRLLQPGQAPRGRRVRGPAGVDLFVVDSPDELAKVAEAAPGARCCAGSSPRATAPTGRCRASTAARRRGGRDPARPGRALGLRAAGVSFHVGSQQRDPRAWEAPSRVAARVFAPLARPDRPVAARPRWRLPGPPRGRLPAAGGVRRGDRAALRRLRRPPADTVAEPGRGLVGDAGSSSHGGRACWRGGPRWVYLDAGVFTGLVETLDEAIRYRMDHRRTAGRPGRRARRADLRQRRRAVRDAPVELPLRSPRATRSGSVRRRLHAPTRRSGSTASRRCRRSSRLTARRARRRAGRGVRRVLAAHALRLGGDVPALAAAAASWSGSGRRPRTGPCSGLTGAARMLPYVPFSWAAGPLGGPLSPRPDPPGHPRRRRSPASARWRLSPADRPRAGRAGGGSPRSRPATPPTRPWRRRCRPPPARTAPAPPPSWSPSRSRPSSSDPPWAGCCSPSRCGRGPSWSRPALAALGLVFSTGITIPGPVEKAPDAVAGMLREVLHCRPALGALGVAGLLNLVVTAGRPDAVAVERGDVGSR